MPTRRRPPRIDGHWLLCALLGLLALSGFSSPALPTEIYPADSVKAAFLYRFTGYVDWPGEALSQSEFTIAVLGSDAITEELGKLLQQHSIKNLPARVRAIRSAGELAGAQMLYVGTQYAGDLRSLIDSLASQPVLVVTDSQRGLDDGSTVNFLLADRRVRFEISLSAAARAGLKLRPDLLAVAAHVRGGPRSELFCMPLFPGDARPPACRPWVAQS